MYVVIKQDIPMFLSLQQVVLSLSSVVTTVFLKNIYPFYLLISDFSAGSCFFYEFTCDNGKCIDKVQKCDENKYNDCGDNSDEEGCGMV